MGAQAPEIQVIYVSDSRMNRERLADILKRHNKGEKHTTIAASYGISRERVRQIVKKAGGRAKQCVRDDAKDRRLSTISELASRGFSVDAIAMELRISQPYVRTLASEAGVRCSSAGLLDNRKKLKRAAGFVLQGASYKVAARKADISATHVRTYCHAIGIKSRHISINPAFSPQKAEGLA